MAKVGWRRNPVEVFYKDYTVKANDLRIIIVSLHDQL
jgi:hypothetical protein